jgi:tetratricopeptide (TPR) repeat protein
LSTKEEFQVTDDENHKESLAIYGDIVVWVEDGGYGYDICGYSLPMDISCAETPEPTSIPTETPDNERLSRSEIISIVGVIVSILSIFLSIFLYKAREKKKKKRYEKSQNKKLITDINRNDGLQKEINSQIKKLKENHRVSDMHTLENSETLEKILTKASTNQHEKIRKAYQQALALTEGGQYDDAYKILQNILNEYPSFYIAWLDLGNALLFMGKNEEAYNAYLEFEKNTNDTAELSKSWHSRANVLLRQGKKEKALNLYEETLKVCTDEFNPLIMISQALIDNKDYDEAITYIEKALSLDLSYPQRIIAYKVKLRTLEKQGKTEEAENIKLEIEKVEECLQFFSKGLEYGKLGHYEKALQKFNRVIEIEPKNSGAYYNKGYALELMRKFPDALDCYSKSISLNPEAENAKTAYSRCAYNVGVQLRSDGESEKAIEYFDRALEYNPSFYECLVAKGDALQDIKRYDDSISLYDQAIKVQPNRVEAYIAKGYSLIMTNEKSKALKCYETVLKINPTNKIAIHNKSGLLREMGLAPDNNGEM